MMKRGTGPTIRAGRHDQPFQSLPSQQAKTTVSQPWNNKRKRDLRFDASALTLVFRLVDLSHPNLSSGRGHFE